MTKSSKSKSNRAREDEIERELSIAEDNRPAREDEIEKELSIADDNRSYVSDLDDDASGKSSGTEASGDQGAEEVPGTDYVYLPSSSCRAIFEGRGKHFPRNPYVCVRGASCNARTGGYHTKLRENPRAEPGYYRGTFHHDKLIGAELKSQLSAKEVKELLEKTKTSDRAHASALLALTEGAHDPPPLNLVPNSQADLLALMQGLCTKIEDMGKTQDATNSALFKGIDEVKLSRISSSQKSILRAPSRPVKNISKTDDRRTATNLSEVSDQGNGSSAGDTTSSESENDVISLKPRQSKRTTHIDSKSESRKGTRLYALAKGKGGSMSVGLYKEHWDKLSFLVEGYSKGRLIKVATPKEGMKYINSYYKDRGLSRPKWIKDKEEHYPSLKKIRHFLRKSQSSSSDSSSDSSDSSSDSSFSYEKNRLTSKKGRGKRRPATNKKKRENPPLTVQREHLGVDPSLGNDNELFKVNLKNVNDLEDGLGIAGIGKTTLRLLLEQIEDMTAYPRHSSTNATEGLGELVEVVTNFNNQDQERRGGASDTGWKHKHRNVLANVKSSTELNGVLSYLQEEQHTILETCAGNMESILINGHVDSVIATEVIASSLAFRISRDTLNSYFNLLNHLAGVNSTLGWARSMDQIKHHGTKLGLIRNKYRSRLQMVCKIYIYLREGQSKNWMSLNLHTAQLNYLSNLVASGNVATSGTSNPSNASPTYGPCSHCKTALHGGGKTNCPWKDTSATEARRRARQALISLETPGGLAAAIAGEPAE